MRGRIIIALAVVGAILVYVSVHVVAAAPDRALVDLNHSSFVGQPVNAIEEAITDLGLPVARARYFAHADFLSRSEPSDQPFLAVYIAPAMRERAETVCDWECVFVLIARTDTSEIFGLPVRHRYQYLFVVENGVTVASFGESSTWQFPLYL